MSSRSGLARAQIDTGLLHDPKVLALARLQRDPMKTAATMMLYVAVILASWKDDGPVPVGVAAPGWWLDPIDHLEADLKAVELLDTAGNIPLETLDRWMAPVRAMLAGGTRGAAARWGANGGPLEGQSPGRRRVSREEKSNTITRASAPAREADGRSFKEIVAAMGYAPEGQEVES